MFSSERVGYMASEKSLGMFQHMDDVELTLCLMCNRACRRRVLERSFVVVSRLGDGIFWYVLILLLPLWYGQEALHVSARMIFVGAAGVVLYKALKSTLVRQRPYIRHAVIHRAAAPLDVYSFPSGHTLHAVSFSTVACWSYADLAWVLVPFAALVAASRVVLGLHYPSDVLAGVGLGFALAGLALLW